ncbi:hypothetical protein KTR10_00020 [Candidatus Kaiserbacteria bacterium]|nr:hypothetical protein [Candidatus Kaiserbacteria bacterium]
MRHALEGQKMFSYIAIFIIVLFAGGVFMLTQELNRVTDELSTYSDANLEEYSLDAIN